MGGEPPALVGLSCMLEQDEKKVKRAEGKEMEEKNDKL